MHYCYFYGGNLDGQVLSHPSPSDTFPTPDFSFPGSPAGAALASAQHSYNLIERWPGPVASAPHWCVYVPALSDQPSPEALWRRLMPFVLGTIQPAAG